MRLNKWYKVLNEQVNARSPKDVIYKQNIKIINEACGGREGYNQTCICLKGLRKYDGYDSFLEFPKVKEILSNYEISELLGAGDIGVAFSLKEPHENYVLKLQILPDKSDYEEYGTKFPVNLYNKQLKGEYDPNEMNVLEAFSEILENNGVKSSVSLFVYSKVSNSLVAGLKNRSVYSGNAFAEFSSSRAKHIIDILVDEIDYYYNIHPKKLKDIDKRIYTITDEIFKNLSRKQPWAAGNKAKVYNDIYFLQNREQILRMISNWIYHYINRENREGALKKILNYIYNVKYFENITKEQFINLGIEYYRRVKEATLEGRARDFHGGNFGFRGKTDIPLSFDV